MPATEKDLLQTPNDPRIRQILEEIEAVRLDGRSVCDGLTRHQFNWRADPRRWSIGQCLEHLVLTARLYPTSIERMIAQSRARQQRERPYREGPFTRWFIRTMEPPPVIRVRTAAKVVPRALLDPETVGREFEESLAEFARLARMADGLSLVHAKMRSPFMPLLQFTLGQTFAVNLAHVRRHLWQARQVRSAPGFPG
jgi:hypothetical protein